MNSDNIKEAAHQWFDFGLHVAPMSKHDKHTRLKWPKWLSDLDSNGHEAIDLSFTDDDWLCAIVDDRVFILDADTPESKAALYNIEKSFDLSPNLIITTKKGEHHYFRRTPGTYAHMAGFNSEEEPQKIDIRTGRSATEGRSVIVLPPSPGKSIELCEATHISDLEEVGQDFINAIFRHNGRDTPRPMPAKEAPEITRITSASEAAEILSFIPANVGYSDWFTVLAGTHEKFNGAVEGLYLVDQWSSPASNYCGFEELEYKWRSFNSTKGITWKSVCDLARNHGADLSAIAKGYNPDGTKRRTYAEILQAAQELTRESDPDSILAICVECHPLSEIEKRRVLKTIKGATGMPLFTLSAAVRESMDTQEPDQLARARKIIYDVGAENIFSADSSVWFWDHSGVWLKLDGRSVKQIVQQRIPEGEGDRPMIDGVTDIMQTEIHKPFHIFNIGHSEAVNCLNGEIILDNSEWKLVPHCREHYRTTQIPVMFDPDATAPMFGKFLVDIFIGGDDTEDKIRAVWEMIGYTLMAHCRHEKFVILVGSGANGKSVLLSVIEALLGSANIAGVQPSMFDRTFQRAHLHMKLANIVTEIKQGEVIDDASLKGIVSGEPTTVENKFKNPFVMRPFATCWFGTNHMPSTRDFSDALFRRALVIPFNNVFKPELGNCDPQLKDKLVTELPGILNMALRAYQRALEQGFTMPVSCLKARDEWRLEADQVAQFVDERCERDPFGSMPVGDLYNACQRWADSAGIQKKVSVKSFRDRMEKLGFGNKRTKSARLVTGIRLVTGDG